jgi:predicted tellurium resistance membrane protein TerC
MEWLLDPSAWLALATLTVLEIVLGIDNVIFLSIIANRLPVEQRAKARRLGLLLAMGMRIALLLALTGLMGLTADLFSVWGNAISGRDLILIAGGAFLLAKSTLEVHQQLEGEEHGDAGRGSATFAGVLAQIAILDMVFSLDSVLTAIGLAEHVGVMVAAIVVAVGVMMWAAEPVAAFVEAHPTVKMLALSFLVLIGFALVADGLGHHVPKGYIYSAVAFSLGVEMLNLRLRKKEAARPVHLRRSLKAAEPEPGDIH